jgi:hypothetical protein
VRIFPRGGGGETALRGSADSILHPGDPADSSKDGKFCHISFEAEEEEKQKAYIPVCLFIWIAIEGNDGSESTGKILRQS